MASVVKIPLLQELCFPGLPRPLKDPGLAMTGVSGFRVFARNDDLFNPFSDFLYVLCGSVVKINAFTGTALYCWIPGLRCASPGMTIVNSFFLCPLRLIVFFNG